jgi:hypothetical protein
MNGYCYAIRGSLLRRQGVRNLGQQGTLGRRRLGSRGPHCRYSRANYSLIPECPEVQSEIDQSK